MTGGVELTGTLRCRPDEVALLQAEIPRHVALTRAEAGCLAFEIRATPDPCSFEVAERFADEAAFAHHQSRTRTSDWWRLTHHMVRDFHVSRT